MDSMHDQEGERSYFSLCFTTLHFFVVLDGVRNIPCLEFVEGSDRLMADDAIDKFKKVPRKQLPVFADRIYEDIYYAVYKPME